MEAIMDRPTRQDSISMSRGNKLSQTGQILQKEQALAAYQRTDFWISKMVGFTFEEGTIFCEITKSLLIKRGEASNFLLSRMINYPRTLHEELSNIDLALETVKRITRSTGASQEVQELQVQQIQQDETVMFKFLDFLRRQHDMNNWSLSPSSNSSPPPVPFYQKYQPSFPQSYPQVQQMPQTMTGLLAQKVKTQDVYEPSPIKSETPPRVTKPRGFIKAVGSFYQQPSPKQQEAMKRENLLREANRDYSLIAPSKPAFDTSIHHDSDNTFHNPAAADSICGTEFGTVALGSGVMDELCQFHRRSAHKKDRHLSSSVELSQSRSERGNISDKKKSRNPALYQRTEPVSSQVTRRSQRSKDRLKEVDYSPLRKSYENQESILLSSSQHPLQPPPAQVDFEVQRKIIEWLEELKVIKPNAVSENQFPDFCRNGVLLCDLVNRLQGRGEPKIRGVYRSPKNVSAIQANLHKVLKYFREKEKINKRYLWCSSQIMEGHKPIIWGFLDDLWYFYHKRISPNDSAAQTAMHRRPPKPTRSSSRGRTRPQALSQIEIHEDKSPYSYSQQISINQNYQPEVPDQKYFSTTSAGQELNEAMSAGSTPKSGGLGQMLEKRGYSNRRQLTQELKRVRFGKARKTLSPSNMPCQRNDQRVSHKVKRGYVIDRISQEQKNMVREWLHSLKFQTFLAVQEAEMLKNPFRNGVLLCELASLFRGQEIKGIVYVPSSFEDCSKNVELGLRYLSTIQTNNQRLVSEGVLTLREEFLRGDKNAIWGLLNELYLKAPSHLKAPDTYAMYCEPSLESTLPYSRQDLYQLERSLVNWLKSNFYGHSCDNYEKLLDFEEQIRSGRLFLRITESLLGLKISGGVRNPKTVTSCIQNMRKAMEPLKKCPKMSQRFLWDQKAIICKMDRGAIFGLLEDLHRFHDGLPARRNVQGFDYFSDGPYLGSLHHQLTTKNESYRQPARELDSEKYFAQRGGMNYQVRPPAQLQIQEIPMIGAQGAVQFEEHPQSARATRNIGAQSCKSSAVLNNTLSPGRYSEKGFEEGRVNPFIPRMTEDIHPVKYFTPLFPNETEICKKKSEHVFDRKKSEPLREKQEELGAWEYFRDQREIAEEEEEMLVAKRRLCRELQEWMEGLGVNVPETMNLEDPVIEEFKDGVLLAQLVSILELNKINGIDPQPYAQASALRNIKKSLKTVSKKSSIPIQYIHAEREIYKGNGRVILGLLHALKQAYKYRTRVKVRERQSVYQVPRTSSRASRRPHPTFGSNQEDMLPRHSFQMTPPRELHSSGTFGTPKALMPAVGPYGTFDPKGYDSSERKNYSLTPRSRKKFLLRPGEAWN